MELRRCTDVAVINAILQCPLIAPMLNDDYSSGTIESADADWMGLYEGGQCLGVFLLVPHNGVTVELHTALLIGGAQALQAGRLLLAHIFTHWRKVVTQVTTDNRAALLMARRSGFTQEGINRASLQRGGVLLDQIVFGMTQGEYLCQQQQQ